MYAKGDSSDTFYFVLKGQLKLMVMENGNLKFSKTVDESTFFGFRDGMGQKRNDCAFAITDNTEVIGFDTIKYKEIIT